MLWMNQTNYERPMQQIAKNIMGDEYLDELIFEYIADKPQIGERMTWAYIEFLGFQGAFFETI